MTSFLKAALQDAELHFAGFGDHGLVPWRVPDEFDFGFVDAFEGEDFAFGVGGNCRAHAAAGGGERHFYQDRGFAVGSIDAAIVDQAEVHDIHGDFGVEHGFELAPHGVLGGAFDLDFFGGLAGVEAEGVGVFDIDAGQASGRCDRVGAAERLGDDDFHASWQGDRVAARDLDGLAIPRELDFGVCVHGLENVYPVAECRGVSQLGQLSDQVAHARINPVWTRFRVRVPAVSSRVAVLEGDQSH